MSVDQETQKEDALKIFRPQAREFAPKVNASAIITVDGPISSSTKKGTLLFCLCCLYQYAIDYIVVRFLKIQRNFCVQLNKIFRYLKFPV